jgi:hypothetical protein
MSVKVVVISTGIKINPVHVVYAPSIHAGDQVVVRRHERDLNPVAHGVCVGGVKPYQSPTTGGRTANVNKDYRTIKITEQVNDNH